MQIAARTAAWAKSGGWVNPYATQGLVAMWDAEWNAGWGVHDEAHRQLDNLCGGEPFVLSSSAVLQDNVLPFNGLTATCEDVSYRPKTIEVCCSVTSGRIVLYFTPFDVGGGLFYTFVVNGGRPTNLFTGGVNNNSTTFLTSDYNLSEITTFCGTYDNENASVINSFANSVKGTRIAKISWGQRTDGMFIGGRSGGGYNGIGELYSIRFYDRVLEDAEVSANNAADLARFGTT